MSFVLILQVYLGFNLFRHTSPQMSPAPAIPLAYFLLHNIIKRPPLPLFSRFADCRFAILTARAAVSSAD